MAFIYGLMGYFYVLFSFYSNDEREWVCGIEINVCI